jgi:hypothetical protein
MNRVPFMPSQDLSPKAVLGRPTNRCSGRGHIKCSAAGGRAKSAPERWRARVLRWRRAAAELNR